MSAQTCREFTVEKGWPGDGKRSKRDKCKVYNDTHCTHRRLDTMGGSICCGCMQLFDIILLPDDDESGLV